MALIHEFASAKVNLSLKVLRRRADGYYEIESVVAFADVGDLLSLEPGAPLEVCTSGPSAGAISGPNLVHRALEVLGEVEPRLTLGAVALEKRLPVAAGLGGGSADAAAVLRAVRRANPNLAHSVDWPGVASALGADVPVCLESRAARIRGKGEILEPFAGLPSLPSVLVHAGYPAMPDKTARVFNSLGASLRGGPAGASAPATLSTIRNVAQWVANVGNDLFEPARTLWPDLSEVVETMRGITGCVAAGMSGAGPACFGLFASEAEAAGAARAVADHRPQWWVRAATLK